MNSLSTDRVSGETDETLQVMDLARREGLPRELDGSDDSRLVDAGLLPSSGRDASAHGSSPLSRGVS